MVVRPQDCTDGDKRFQEQIVRWTNYIDQYLKSHWKNGTRLIVPMPFFYRDCTNKYSVQEEVERLYTKAGWDIRFESSQFEPEPWIRIAAK